MREIVQILSLPDQITVRLRKKGEKKRERRMTIMHVNAPDEIKIEEEDNPGTSEMTQLVALVEDGRHRTIEPVLPVRGGELLPVGDIEDVEVISITF